ncbi:calcium-binding protein, partial [Methylovulum sp.]|uniref:beta strand repeat-containing protein n=1 Tax=Methylovulum sp. TaxID=1916980 RepID=UPI00260FFE39
NDKFYGGYDRMFGGAGDDSFYIKNKGTVIGGIGNDTITVSNTDAKLDSWLEGGLGNDKITAGSGNDVLFSGYGVDELTGGAGNDSYVITFDDFVDKTGEAGFGAKTINESPTGGVDTEYFIRDFKGDGRDDDADSDGKEFDPLATDIDYVVTLDSWIENGVLDDQIYVNNPSVLTYFIAWLNGNELNNNLKGSNLYDILDGGIGNDTISAGDGNDVIFAGTDADKIDGGAGEDIIAAWASYSLETSLVTNVEDIDLLDDAGAANATGNKGNNVLYGNNANNILTGGAGNDILDGWYYTNYYFPTADKTTGIDTLRGGSGDDTYRIDEVTDVVDELTGNNGIITNGGTDTVQFKSAAMVTSYTLTDGVENLTIVANLKEGVGNDLNNRIIGDSLANILIGKFGDDYLDGGTGVDVFTGGYGDDTYVVSDVTETINENPGQGNDWMQSGTISLDLARDNWGGNVENARLTGTSNLDLHGTTVNNRLLGNAGNNRLDGDGGIDILIGGLGNDVYKVDTTTDTLLEEVNPQADASGNIKTGWIDSVESLVNYTLLANFENLSLLGAAIIGTGNDINNAMLGNDQANTLYGLGGNDILNGGKGLDTLVGGLGDDTYQLYQDKETVTELASQGTDTIIVDYDVLSLVANIENLVLNADAALKGTGNSVNNVITGNGKNNTLMGLAGDDTLIAGEGLDVLTGGLGADVLNLAETLQVSDKVVIALGDSLADEVKTADRIVKFGLAQDILDLAGTLKIAANINSSDGDNAAIFKSHSIANGIIRFDDLDVFSSPVSITATNLSDAVEYLKLNITDGSIVAFQGMAPDPATNASALSTWVFQDNGVHDTLVALVGVTTATSFSTTAFSSTSIHLA